MRLQRNRRGRRGSPGGGPRGAGRRGAYPVWLLAALLALAVAVGVGRVLR